MSLLPLADEKPLPVPLLGAPAVMPPTEFPTAPDPALRGYEPTVEQPIRMPNPTYYLRHQADDPHLPNPRRQTWSRCGLDLAGARPVTALQVQVWLAGRHCGGCTPALHRPDSPQRRVP